MTYDAPRVAVLGPVTLRRADGATSELGATARALVAALALAAPAPRSAEALAEDVWGDEPPQNPRGALQTLVSRLRSAGGADLVRSTPAGYALAATDPADPAAPGPDPAAPAPAPTPPTDLALARSLTAELRRLPDADPGRLALAERALSLWRGEPGADLGRAPIAAELADAAATLHETLSASRARSLVALGRAGEAVDALAALAAARPYDEPRHAELMRALAADGRAPEALAVFAELRHRLRDDLGSSPGLEAADLNALLLRQQGQGVRVRVGLRAAPNTLLGRDDDLDRVAELLTRSRAVTILGAGGLGKTRLAQAVAAASDLPAVIVAELASVRTDDDVLPAVAGALGVSEASATGRLGDALPRPDLPGRVLAQLGERPTLLVLDNCEQVIDGVARWAAEALAAIPGLRVLATSRTALGIAAEAVYPLGSLEAGEADQPGPAERLFVERARAVRPDAILARDVVRRLCARLDGMPLAIELAAARVRTMTPEQIEVRLADRFALLTTGDRAAPERHRTLDAVISWSWDLLDTDAREAMATLAVLPAGFSAATAQEVLRSRADDLLDRLAAQSLLVVVEDPVRGSIRFRMLETVREFALARLQEEGRAEEAAEAVRRWARSFATARMAHAFEVDVFHDIRAESDNLLFVLRRAIADDRPADVVLLAGVLVQSWMLRGAFSEIEAFGDPVYDALTRVGEHEVPPVALVSVMVPVSFFLLVADRTRFARLIARLRMLGRRHPDLPPLQRAALAVVVAATRPDELSRQVARLRADPDPRVALIGEATAAQLAENDGDPVAGQAAALRASHLADELGEVWLGAMAASSYGQLAAQSDDPQTALEWIERARQGLAQYDGDGDVGEQSWIRGNSLTSLGRYDEAREIFAELAAADASGDESRELASIGSFGLAEVDRAEGDAPRAVAGYLRAVSNLRALGDRSSSWYLMVVAGFVSAAAFDALLPAPEAARWAGRLRTRALATRRLRAQLLDRPVFGSVMCGWSAWALTVPELRERGLEALALAEAIGVRQDIPSLRLAEHVAHAESLVGAAAVAGARRAVAGLAAGERLERAVALLARSGR